MLSTKIVCTIGPASDTSEVLEELAEAGMNVARLNFSHGTHTSHKKIIKQIHELNRNRKFPIAIMLDTQGPEIRTGNEKSTLKSKEIVTVSCPPFKENEGNIHVNYPALKSDLKPGNYISLDSGLVKLKVIGKHKIGLKCKVIDGGIVNGHRHVNLPGTVVKLPGITKNDKRDILFGIKHKVNFIALSFVRNSETIKEVRKLLGKHAEHTEIIAKVENLEGVERLEEIVKEADGVMVARGDLGIEAELEEVPQIQRRIAFLCAKYGKRAIVATHMLESMIEHPVPTRAEVTDVANAVFEESDAIMLSGETSIGNYPVRSVETLKRIAKRTEIFPGVNFSKNLIMEKNGQHIAASAIQIASDLKIRAAVVITRNGRGARYLSNLRPHGIIIYSFTENADVLTSNVLYRGVYPFLLKLKKNPEDTIQDALKMLKNIGHFNSNEQVIVLANILTGEGFNTSLQVRTIPSD